MRWLPLVSVLFLALSGEAGAETYCGPSPCSRESSYVGPAQPPAIPGRGNTTTTAGDAFYAKGPGFGLTLVRDIVIHIGDQQKFTDICSLILTDPNNATAQLACAGLDAQGDYLAQRAADGRLAAVVFAGDYTDKCWQWNGDPNNALFRCPEAYAALKTRVWDKVPTTIPIIWPSGHHEYCGADPNNPLACGGQADPNDNPPGYPWDPNEIAAQVSEAETFIGATPSALRTGYLQTRDDVPFTDCSMWQAEIAGRPLTFLGASQGTTTRSCFDAAPLCQPVWLAGHRVDTGTGDWSPAGTTCVNPYCTHIGVTERLGPDRHLLVISDGHGGTGIAYDEFADPNDPDGRSLMLTQYDATTGAVDALDRFHFAEFRIFPGAGRYTAHIVFPGFSDPNQRIDVTGLDEDSEGVLIWPDYSDCDVSNVPTGVDYTDPNQFDIELILDFEGGDCEQSFPAGDTYDWNDTSTPVFTGTSDPTGAPGGGNVYMTVDGTNGCDGEETASTVLSGPAFAMFALFRVADPNDLDPVNSIFWDAQGATSGVLWRANSDGRFQFGTATGGVFDTLVAQDSVTLDAVADGEWHSIFVQMISGVCSDPNSAGEGCFVDGDCTVGACTEPTDRPGYEIGEQEVYIDGDLVDRDKTLTNKFFDRSTVDITLGFGDGTDWVGDIDEVHVWSQAFSPMQICEMAEQYPDGPGGDWGYSGVDCAGFHDPNNPNNTGAP